jgi:hypothetical protein
MGNEGLPVSLGIIIGAAVLGALIAIGLIIGLLLTTAAAPPAV